MDGWMDGCGVDESVDVAVQLMLKLKLGMRMLSQRVFVRNKVQRSTGLITC